MLLIVSFNSSRNILKTFQFNAFKVGATIAFKTKCISTSNNCGRFAFVHFITADPPSFKPALSQLFCSPFLFSCFGDDLFYFFSYVDQLFIILII